MNPRAVLLAGLGFALSARRARAEPPAADHAKTATARPSERADEPAVAPEAGAAPSWRLEATGYFYFVPESSDYVQPTVRLDRRLLHVEARYSYEDLLTGSAWLGINAGGDAELGAEVWWEITPLLGGVFGRTNGLALGYEGALGFWKLELYSEGEYLFDLDAGAEDFFFNWSEFTLSPFDCLRVGIMAERTRIFSSGRELERGLLAGVSHGALYLTLHVLNPDDSRPLTIVALGGHFER